MNQAQSDAGKPAVGLLRQEVFSDEGGLDWLRPARAVGRPKLALIVLGNLLATVALIVAALMIQHDQVVRFRAAVADEPTGCAPDVGGTCVEVDVVKNPAMRYLRVGDRMLLASANGKTLHAAVTAIETRDTHPTRRLIRFAGQESISPGPVQVSVTMRRSLLSVISRPAQ